MSKNYWEQDDKKYSGGTAALGQTGLQQFMVSTFTWMAFGLALTGVVAALTLSSGMVLAMMQNPLLFWGAIIAELGLVIGFGVAMRKGVSAPLLLGMFLGYAALNGFTLSLVLFAYTFESVAATFFITAGTFGAMAAYGYFTKRDLTGVGQFMFMGLIGIIIASVVNIFIGSSALGLAISVLGVLIFVGLTAYDTQKLKAYYHEFSHDNQGLKRVALYGALTLYLDFINLFLMLLRLLGNRR